MLYSKYASDGVPVCWGVNVMVEFEVSKAFQSAMTILNTAVPTIEVILGNIVLLII